MGLKLGSVKGYYFLVVWVLANIIQIATYKFCKRFLNKSNDPGGRMFDQMTMAARACTANIAEGYSRHQTSRETEMKLLDVARATLSELHSDYFFWINQSDRDIWSRHSKESLWVFDHKFNRPNYTDDWDREAQQHIRAEYQRLAPLVENDNIYNVNNGMLILCDRGNLMLERLIQSRLGDFKQEGGFTENLTKERLDSLTKKAEAEDAPKCPLCGQPMLLRTAKKGIHKGRQFWSCSAYPQCTGTRNV